jgi:LysR family glycine cleavage system transcriptional activator
VYISPSEHLVDFGVESFDLGIRYGSGEYPELAVEKLCGDALVAVCAPSLVARRKLKVPGDLKQHVLLHDDAPEGWSTWLDHQRAHGVDPSRGTVLIDSSMLVEAAIQGQGVALARLSLALSELAAGRLILPFPEIAPAPTALTYYIVGLREHVGRPAVAAFRTWLHEEALDLKRALSRQGWPRYTRGLRA